MSAVKTEDNETSGNKELLERVDIDGTPFQAVGNQEDGYFLAMGRFKLSQPCESPEKIIEYINENEYKIILSMIICVVEDITRKVEHPTTATGNTNVNK